MNDPTREAIAAQLLAMRSQIDATLMLIGGGGETTEEPEGCQHPAERRVGLRGGVWACRDCGYSPGEEGSN